MNPPPTKLGNALRELSRARREQLNPKPTPPKPKPEIPETPFGDPLPYRRGSHGWRG